MVSFFHTMLVVAAYVFIAAFSLFYLAMGIALARGAKDLRLMAAPDRAGVLTEKFLQPEWEDLTEEEQAIAKKRLPIAIFGYVCIWLTYLCVAFLAVKYFYPGIIQFFSNI